MRFGLITEGITDQLVARTIIRAILNHETEQATTTPLAPLEDEPSGFTKVLSYIASADFREFLVAPDTYVVIQLDTDTRSQWLECIKDEAALELVRAIPEVTGGDKQRVPEIVEKVMALIRCVIGADFYDTHKERIIPAISVNEMECWVLPYHAQSNSDKEKMVQCLNSLNKLLTKQGYTISPNSKASGDFKYYQRAIKDMTKRKTLLDKYHHNESLKIFVDRLLAI